NVEQIQAKLDGMPPVEPAEVAALQGQLTATEANRLAEEAELERRQQLEFQAREWCGLQKRLAEFRQQEEASLALLQESETIERAFSRLREIKSVLPH